LAHTRGVFSSLGLQNFQDSISRFLRGLALPVGSRHYLTRGACGSFRFVKQCLDPDSVWSGILIIQDSVRILRSQNQVFWGPESCRNPRKPGFRQDSISRFLRGLALPVGSRHYLTRGACGSFRFVK
jgi:hypothetical protein